MTTILGICKEINGKSEVFCSSDSRATLGGEILDVSERKMVLFPNFVVMFTGLATQTHVIKEMSQDKSFLRQNCCKMRNAEDASNFGKAMMGNLKYALEHSPDVNSGSDSRLIICTPTEVYSVDNYFYAYSPRFICDGSGGLFSQGWLEGIYDDIETVEDMEREVRKAMQISAMKDSGTGGEIHLLHVTRDVLPEPPATKRKIVKVKKEDE